MNEIKWTKGEWLRQENCVYALQDGNYNRFDLLVQAGYTDVGRTSKEEIMATAQLIKSAPKLYESLKELYLILHEDEHYATYNPKMKLAENALKEARGEIKNDN
jgi:hypothetical protein